MRGWQHKWAVVFRLSIVVGVGYGVFDAYQTLDAWNQDRISYSKNKAIMDCTVKLSDDWLSRNTNEFGNIDVAPICGAGENGTTFFVNMGEVQNARKGEDSFATLLWRKPFDLQRSTLAFLLAFFLVNAVGASLIGLYSVARWVVRG